MNKAMKEFYLKNNKKGFTMVELIIVIAVLAILWLISYMVSNLDVLLLRRRLPNAPRNFKVPFGNLLPILGILGSGYMIYSIDPSVEVKLLIYKVVGITIVALSIYSFFWVKIKVKRPLFQPYAIKEVMAMESDLYSKFHKKF